MASETNLATSDLTSLITASKKIFKLIGERLNVQTVYITKKDDSTMTIISSYNEKEEIIEEGFTVESSEAYCKLIIMNDKNFMTTFDLNKNLRTKNLEVTEDLNVKGFLGVTLTDLSGNIFGTLCVVDKEQKDFSEADVEYLRLMADVLSHMIDSDQTKYNMAFLTVPIIPITEGISILPIQGIIDEHRSEKIMSSVLQYGADHHINYFIIDLSGLVITDGVFPNVLTDLLKTLQLMGIRAVVTGITPEIAKYDNENGQLSQLQTTMSRNLESALSLIGFSLTEE